MDPTHPQDRYRLEERFLALVGHQLRTPITVIGGWLELLAHADVEDQREAAVAASRRSVNRLERLADDLADLAAASVGELELERKRGQRPRSLPVPRRGLGPRWAGGSGHRTRHGQVVVATARSLGWLTGRDPRPGCYAG